MEKSRLKDKNMDAFDIRHFSEKFHFYGWIW